MTRARAARVTVAGELRDLVTLALPLCVGHLGHQFMAIVDTALLGRYGGASLAGAGLAGNLLFAVTVLGIGTIMGMDTLVPQSLGAGDSGRAREIFRSGIRLALIVSLPISAGVAAIALLLPHSGVEPGVAAEGAAFLFGRLPGIMPILLFATMRSYLQAHHVTRPMVIAVVIANVVNFVVDWILIFGDGGLEQLGLPGVGLPALGALGAGISTSAASLGSLAICAAAVRSLHRSQDAELAPARPAASTTGHARAIVRLGGPVGLQLVAEVGIFALTGYLAGTLGRMPAAGHQIALVLASFSFSTAIGIGAATSVQVGRAIGAGDTRAARRAGALGMVTGAGVMGACALCFLLFPRQLAALFTGDRALQDAAIPLLRIAAVFQLSDAVQAVSAGALRGVGATRFSFVANVIGHYAVGFPVAVLLGFALDMGAAGLWWGLSIGLTGVAVAQSIRFGVLTARPVERAAAS
ncbi:MAG TPA: MATE family efflux transporter [Kofleriaceae bacterium]|nr:MATE family efflux transporter [Kofleriaceae bacterium]